MKELTRGIHSVVFLCNNWWQWMEQKLPPSAAPEQEKRWHRAVGGALVSQSAPNLHRTGQPTHVCAEKCQKSSAKCVKWARETQQSITFISLFDLLVK